MPMNLKAIIKFLCCKNFNDGNFSIKPVRMARRTWMATIQICKLSAACMAVKTNVLPRQISLNVQGMKKDSKLKNEKIVNFNEFLR